MSGLWGVLNYGARSANGARVAMYNEPGLTYTQITVEVGEKAARCKKHPNDPGLKAKHHHPVSQKFNLVLS